jgi:hypothetical protein
MDHLGGPDMTGHWPDMAKMSGWDNPAEWPDIKPDISLSLRGMSGMSGLSGVRGLRVCPSVSGTSKKDGG